MYAATEINAAMGEHRLTNKTVAAKAGVTPKVVSAIRNGKQNILLTSLNAVAEALGLSVEIRFTQQPESNVPSKPAR